MKKLFLLLALSMITAHAADQQTRNGTNVRVFVDGVGIFKYRTNTNQNIWDAAHQIAAKESLTVLEAYYYMPNAKNPTSISPHVNYSLNWHQQNKLPLYIFTERKDPKAKLHSHIKIIKPLHPLQHD